jgi:hypothetical protein
MKVSNSRRNKRINYQKKADFLIFNRLFNRLVHASMIMHHIPSRTLVGGAPLSVTWECW